MNIGSIVQLNILPGQIGYENYNKKVGVVMRPDEGGTWVSIDNQELRVCNTALILISDTAVNKDDESNFANILTI